MSGALAILVGGELQVDPNCCSDLGDLSEWREAADYRGSEWQMLWIGHPWLSVRFEDGLLVLSEPHESNSPEAR